MNSSLLSIVFLTVVLVCWIMAGLNDQARWTDTAILIAVLAVYLECLPNIPPRGDE